MSNEEIMHELLLKFKGARMGAKILLIEQIRDIVGISNFDSNETIKYISNSGYFMFYDSNTATLTEEGFEYANKY